MNIFDTTFTHWTFNNRTPCMDQAIFTTSTTLTHEKFATTQKCVDAFHFCLLLSWSSRLFSLNFRIYNITCLSVHKTLCVTNFAWCFPLAKYVANSMCLIINSVLITFAVQWWLIVMHHLWLSVKFEYFHIVEKCRQKNTSHMKLNIKLNMPLSNDEDDDGGGMMCQQNTDTYSSIYCCRARRATRLNLHVWHFYCHFDSPVIFASINKNQKHSRTSMERVLHEPLHSNDSGWQFSQMTLDIFEIWIDYISSVALVRLLATCQNW